MSGTLPSTLCHTHFSVSHWTWKSQVCFWAPVSPSKPPVYEANSTGVMGKHVVTETSLFSWIPQWWHYCSYPWACPQHQLLLAALSSLGFLLTIQNLISLYNIADTLVLRLPFLISSQCLCLRLGHLHGCAATTADLCLLKSPCTSSSFYHPVPLMFWQLKWPLSPIYLPAYCGVFVFETGSHHA